MANFQLIPGPNFQAQLRQGVLREGSRQFFTRVIFNVTSIIGKIGNFLVTAFENTEVAQALRGNGSDDLAAHFGLTDSQANSLVDSMGIVIKNSVSISTRPLDTGGTVEIRAIPLDYSAFLALSDGEYISQPSNITIPVMKWLLLDPNIDIGQAAFDIVFSGERGAAIDARIDKISRSGRAIMVSLEQLGGGGGYVLPEIVRGNAGSNFLEFVIRQPGVAQEVAQIVIGSV